MRMCGGHTEKRRTYRVKGRTLLDRELLEQRSNRRGLLVTVTDPETCTEKNFQRCNFGGSYAWRSRPGDVRPLRKIEIVYLRQRGRSVTMKRTTTD